MFGMDFREILGYLMNIYILAMVVFVGYHFISDTERILYWKRHNIQKGEPFTQD